MDLEPLGGGLLNHLVHDLHEASRDFLPVVLFRLEALESLVAGEDKVPRDKGTHALEAELLDGELLTGDVEHGNVLGYGLAGHQRRGDGGARLHHVEARFGVLAGVDLALVLVAPDDEVHPVREDVFGQVRGGGIGVVVLVDGQEVEPVGGLDVGAEPLNLVVAKRAKHALVAHVAEAVQGEPRAALLEEDGLGLDVVGLGDAAKVVDEAGDLQQVEGAKVTLAAGVVVVAVDGEDGDGDVDVGVLIVDVVEGAFKVVAGVAEELELAGPGTQAVLAEAAHHLVHGLAGGFVVVKEVAAEEDHVDLFIGVSVGPKGGRPFSLVPVKRVVYLRREKG